MKFNFAKTKYPEPTHSEYLHRLIITSRNLTVNFLLDQKPPVSSNYIYKYKYNFSQDFPRLSSKLLTEKKYYTIHDVQIADVHVLNMIARQGKLFHWDLTFIRQQILKQHGFDMQDNGDYHLRALLTADIKLIKDMQYYILTPEKNQSLIVMPKITYPELLGRASVQLHKIKASSKTIANITSSIIASKTGNSV